MLDDKRIPRTYKLDPETLGQIDKLARSHRSSKTDVVETAVLAMYQKEYGSNTGETPEKTEADKALELLGEQLAVKDEQIKALNAALTAAQDTARAAQALHGAEKVEHQALESQEAKLSRWERLKAAWRG